MITPMSSALLSFFDSLMAMKLFTSSGLLLMDQIVLETCSDLRSPQIETRMLWDAVEGEGAIILTYLQND